MGRRRSIAGIGTQPYERITEWNDSLASSIHQTGPSLWLVRMSRKRNFAPTLHATFRGNYTSSKGSTASN